ncbi:hypothetical protein Poli38472_007751 [Pythium oligandrum]|uniref:Poly [ADP-ribose] polymerase n=1 Tax=Pythium oligandrum TaxID=41045 RepID=A0A8K1CR55_PYTOL|nr:hypothetical protein Poli38472_007751 [Pythium oligandrum]|eukprot:TMW68079.1 hypothetical protein Poli38472_007751 [Pythium oligandrum]
MAAEDGKRKWAEVDWEVAMEAQTYVAVFAASSPEEKEVSPATVASKKRRGRPPKDKGKAATRRKGKRAKVAEEEQEAGGEDEETAATTTSAAVEEFWLAQLLDDVTENMLESDVGVHMRWLNKRASGPPNCYDYAYDEVVDVQTILCQVYLQEHGDGTLELTDKSLARVQRCLRRTKGEAAGGDEDMSEEEKPPPSKRKRRSSVVRDVDDDGETTRRRRGSTSGGGSGRRSSTTKKLSKREEAMHIPPRCASVEVDKYEDTEIQGNHAFDLLKDDVVATGKEVIRAVVTKNHTMLKKLTEDMDVYKHLHSFSVLHGVDVKKSAIHYAVEADDLTAAGMLINARKIESKHLATSPAFSLPSHSTGKHTSSYSDYNRRAINASRGGREGNNALMEDKENMVASEEDNFLWECNTTSVKMLTLFFPTGDWSNYTIAYNVGRVCRVGNYKLAHKLIETLGRNGGWGFNDLHVKVLSDTDEELPAFRSASAIKQAYNTKIRPLHLACINPNTKYLETLWDSAGTEWSSAKDDLAYEPIHFAAACESTAPLAFLLERKCNMFARNKHRQTPIMRAITARREENAIFILDKAAEEDDEILQKAISEHGPGSFQPIHYAAYRNCPRVLEHLLKKGADVNSVCEGKMTPLCIAAREGYYDCVKVLLDHGAKVDLGNKLKKTPLIFAVKNGHTRVAALLVNHGANVNAYDTSDNSVAHYAASYGWKSCLELLMDAGAEFWAKNSWGFVPLTCALLKQRQQCAEFILEKDPNQQFVDFRDRDGCTMLFLQCKHSTNTSQLKYLLDKGLNPNVGNSENEHPLQVMIARAAASKSRDEDLPFYVDAVRLLLENGANANIEIERNEQTADNSSTLLLQPLQLAIQGQLRDIFLMLLNDFNADPDLRGSDGSDVWMAAAYLGQKGEAYLEDLIKHQKKGQKLRFEARNNAGDNFFHCVSSNVVRHPISPELVQTCLKKCADPGALLNGSNKDGLTPLQKLLKNERNVPSDDLSAPEHADKLDEIRKADIRYADLVGIFAAYATDPVSWCMYMDENKAKAGGADLATETYAELDTLTAVNASNDGESDSDEDEDDEDDEEDEDEESEDGDNEDKSNPTKTVPETTSQSKGVKVASILHLAVNRKLKTSPDDAKLEWYGQNLVNLLLTKIKFDKATIDFPDYAKFKTPLDYAVQHNDAESVSSLLAKKANPNHSPVKCPTCVKENTPCTNGCKRDPLDTSLVVAARNHNVEICRLLLHYGADVKCYEQGSLSSPLHLAMESNDVEITSYLLEHNADLSKVNTSGSTPLHLAVSARHSVVAQQPHEGEVEYTETESLTLPGSGKVSAISVALQSDQAKHVVIHYDSKKLTPIHLASANRDLELLRALVLVSDNKKDCVNKPDAFERTPLHHAVNAASMSPDASFEVERFLLQSGADPNAVDEFGFGALHFALFKLDLDWHFRYDEGKDKTEAKREREDGTYEEKKKGAFQKVFNGIPASATDPVETVSNLTSIKGIDTTTQDTLGRSPLHLAAATGAFVCASALLAIHASSLNKSRALSVVDTDGFTPLGRAVLYLRETTIMTLLQNGADVDGLITTGKDGEEGKTQQWSYFYHAVKHSLTGICHMLLNAKFPKRQAVEDALLCGQFQLANNLMVGIEVSTGSTLLTRENSRQETPLHALAKVDKPFDDLARSIAWTFVDAGVALNHKNNVGNSPLHYAAKVGNIHLMDFLLHNKCEMNQVNKEGETPLLYSLKRSKAGVGVVLDVVKYFLSKSTLNLHIKDRRGVNILSAFVDRFVNDEMIEQKVFFEHVEALMKKGIDVNTAFVSSKKKDFFENELFGSSVGSKMPLLIRAVYAKPSSFRCNVMGALLRYGAKVNVVDGNGFSLMMHLTARNMISELNLVLGKTKTLRDPVDSKSTKVLSIHVPAGDVKQALAYMNKQGQTVLHIAVKPTTYGSYENAEIIELLLAGGASLQGADKNKKSPVDYMLDQSSRFLYRYIRSKHPKFAPKEENEVFDDAMEAWTDIPDYVKDASAYIEECEATGKITRTRVKPQPNSNCDVGSLKRVFGEVDENDNVVPGEEFDALLTKVDVKNGRFGLNVFYKCQIVHDQIQDLYVVFTNWGRIGEEGKFQNTPFHSAEDAIVEFKKIFRSKTGNHWKDRHEFVKHDKKYNLVQRVNYHTKLKDEVTTPFIDSADSSAFAPSGRGFAPSVTDMLCAITDIRNLQLAATESCNYRDNLPLANAAELRGAVAKLLDVRNVIESRNKLDEEMNQVRSDISDDASSKLDELSKKHAQLTEEISEKSSRYYEVMPCNEDSFGSSIKAFDNIADVNAEITRLNLLIDITQTYKMIIAAKRNQHKIHPLDYCYDAMQVNLAPLAQDSQEATLLTKYFFNGIRPCERKSYRISNLFEVSRNGERSRFVETLNDKPTLKEKHSHLLWHGTKRTNLMGILSQGLRIAPPEAPHQGYMYGKGLYFANVTAKSLAYCDDPYLITSKTKDKDGNEVNKERKVHYLLLCEVAVGSPTKVTAARTTKLYGQPVEAAESVHACGHHTPDPLGMIVSPLSGAALPLGTVGQVGVAFPIASAWAKSTLTPEPWNYYDRNPKNAPETLEYWGSLIEKLNEGETFEVDKAEEKELFFTYYSDSKTITVQMLTKNLNGGGDDGPWCDATLKITATCKPNTNGVDFSWHVKHYRNVFLNTPLEEGFSLIQTDRSQYDEVIVYNEGQARIRYLVEVESL